MKIVLIVSRRQLASSSSLSSILSSYLLSNWTIQRRRFHQHRTSISSPSSTSTLLFSPQRQQQPILGTVKWPTRIQRRATQQTYFFLSTIHTTTSSMIPSMDCTLRIDPEIQYALLNHHPVVALESTIIAQGSMPYPQNLELAIQVEDMLRKECVYPATIAIKNGIPCIGLTKVELEDLAQSSLEKRVTKVSTRELPHLIVSNRTNKTDNNIPSTTTTTYWGATTVASTMRLAYLAGISTFVTGGIGGVHKHGETTMDISADLTELSRTPVIVVSAGIKSILDIAKTLEVLETLSVPVYTWQSNDFPAFFSPTSGLQSPARVDTPEQIANAYHVSQTLLQLPSGILVAVPNPQTTTVGHMVENAIQEALQEASQQNITGKDVTPFVLHRVSQLTNGATLQSNIALIKHNATVGAQIAKAMAHTKYNHQYPSPSPP